MNAADHGKRSVMPQWLPFHVSAQQREAHSFLRPNRPLDFSPALPAFEDALAHFHTSPSPFVATEIMGMAHVLGKDLIARELAEYVLSETSLGAVAHTQAHAILGTLPTTQPKNEKLSLRMTKQRVRNFSRDAITWADQARLYTVLGVYEHARKSILAAIHLAPSDRFVVRAAIRFFVHFNRWDEALRIAQKAFNLSNDPLIFGPLLSVAIHLNKLPSKLKATIDTAMASSAPFLHSETLEAFGVLEINSGADKRSKRFFRQAWIDPARSVIGHSQLILREHLPSLAAEQRINFSESKEAVSWLRFTMLDFSGSLAASNDWVLEEPYSRAPHILGSSTACVIENYDQAETIAKRGLLANPRDSILTNNLAFAELRNGKIEAAEKTFEPLLSSLADKSQVAPLATFGLLQMAKGLAEDGTKHYHDAISRALDLKNRRLAVHATLNYIISAMDTMKELDVASLKFTQTSLREVADPICFGAALAIIRRLKKSDLNGTDTMSVAAREFTEAVEAERKEYMNSSAANLLNVSRISNTSEIA